MKGKLILCALSLVTATRLRAQSDDQGSRPLVREWTALHLKANRTPLTVRFDIRTALTDTARAKNHDVRNGAIIGASVGFAAGAIGGGILSKGCDNCSIYRGAFTYMGAVGGAGAIVGGIVGGVTGRIVEWSRR